MNDAVSHAGLGNSTITMAVFKNKGCRDKNFLNNFEMPATDLFEYESNACSPISSDGTDYYIRIEFQM